MTELKGEDKQKASEKNYERHTGKDFESWRVPKFDEVYRLEVDIEIDGEKDAFDGTQYFWIYLENEHWYIEPSNGDYFLDYILS